jgi:hypothetical protein
MKFEIGKTYSTRSIGDHNCIISIKVVRRTEKTLYVEGDELTKKSLRIFMFDKIERVTPWGRFSMAPIISAK